MHNSIVKYKGGHVRKLNVVTSQRPALGGHNSVNIHYVRTMILSQRCPVFSTAYVLLRQHYLSDINVVTLKASSFDEFTVSNGLP